MPIYEYRCRDCGKVWERREHMSEHERVTGEGGDLCCPQCDAERVQQVFSPFFAKTDRKS